MFKKVFFSTVFVASNLFTGPALAASNPFTTKASQVDVILNSDRKDQKRIDFIIIVGTIATAMADFNRDPKAHTIIDEIGGKPRPMEMEEFVMDKYYRAVQYDLSALDDSLDLLGAVPGQEAGLISTTLNYLVSKWKKNGQLSVSPENPYHFESVGAVVEYLANQPGKIGAAVRRHFKMTTTYDWESDLFIAKEVQTELDRIGDKEFEEFFEETVEDVAMNFEELGEAMEEIRGEMDEQKKRALEYEINIKKQNIRNELNAAMNTAGTLAQALGRPELAENIQSMAKIMQAALSLADGSAGGPMGVASAYVNIAVTVVSMFSEQNKGPSGMDIMARQVRAILNVVLVTREEMNQRFDSVDEQLNEIMVRMDASLRAIKESQGRIEENIIRIQTALQDHDALTQTRINDLYRRMLTDELSVCLNDEFKTGFTLDAKEFTKCLLYIDNNVNKYSAYTFDSISQGKPSLEDAQFESVEFPYVSYLPRAVQILRRDFGVDIPGEDELLNPMSWSENVKNLEKLYWLHPAQASPAGNAPLLKAIKSGRGIEDVYRALAFKQSSSGKWELNVRLFDVILERYAKNMELATKWIRKNNYNTEAGFHPGLGADQPYRGDRPDRYKKMKVKGCKGSKDFGVAKIPAYKGVPPPVQQMWPNAYVALPDRLMWLDKLIPFMKKNPKDVPPSVEVCFQRYQVGAIVNSPNGKTTSKVDVILAAQVLGKTVATARIPFTFTHNTSPYKPDWTVDDFKYTLYWEGRNMEIQSTKTGQMVHFYVEGYIYKSFRDIAQWTVLPAMQEVVDPILNAKFQEAAKDRFVAMISDGEFKELKRETSELRNLLMIMVYNGINSELAGRREIEKVFYPQANGSSRDRFVELENYVMMDLTETGEPPWFSFKSAMDRFKRALGQAKAGDKALPRNPTIERALFELEYLMKPEVAEVK